MFLEMATGNDLFGRTEDNAHNAGSVKGSGAEFEEKVGCIPAEHPRGLIVGVANIPRNNGIGNAQGRLAEAVVWSKY